MDYLGKRVILENPITDQGEEIIRIGGHFFVCYGRDADLSVNCTFTFKSLHIPRNKGLLAYFSTKNLFEDFSKIRVF